MDTASLIRFAANRNPEWVEKRVAEAYAYKEGKHYEGVSYNNVKEIWRDRGVISYEAFKSRYRRGHSIAYSLGVE